MKYRFRELVDIPSLQELTDELYKATSIPSAIVDMEGDILTGSGWQRICTEFHRKHPEIEKDCIESDTRIREQLDKGESYAIYKCPRGLVDASSPVIIDGEHVANVFIGQLFFEPPDAETERLFREQAKKFGLDEEKYIEAYHEVPVYPEDKFRSALSFLSKFAQLVASIGLTRMKEKIAEEAWRKSQLFNETILNSSPDVIYVYDIIERMNVYSNDGIMNVLGYTAQDMKDMGDKLIAIIMHPDDFQIYLKETLPRYQSAEDNEFIKHEYRMKNKDGEWRWLHSQESVFMRLEDGTPKQIFGIIRDITEQKKTAGALRVSEEKYRSFVEDFHGIAFRGDLNFKPSFFHGAVEEITGYSEKEFVAGKLRWDQVVHSEDFKAILLEDVGRLQTIPDYSNVREYRIIHKNGDIRWVQETINNICDDSGKPAIVQGTICDITEHKLAEITINTTLEKLKHSQDELDRMFQFADYMVCIADLEKGYFTKISPAFTRRLGWSEKELLSKPILDFIHPDDVKKTADIIEEQMEKGLDVLQFENRYRTKKGDFRWFEWSANPIPEEGITYSAAYDITERKKAEEALRDSEAKKNALISNISDVIAILDEQGVVQYKSPNIEQHFGWLPEDLVGTDGWETVHIDDRERVQKEFMELIQNKDLVKTVEYRYKCKDGNFRPIELTAANLLHDPLINGILANYHDITNRKKAEQELLESKEFNEKIISESPIGIVIYDETGQCIAANDSLGKMIGATKKQVLAQNYTKLESWQKYGLLDTAKKALHDNETKFHFSKVITTFGKYVYLEYYFVPFKRAGRNYIMLMANDITERKKTEEALRDSEVNLKEAQNVANMGSWVWDLKTNFVTWSDNLCRIHGMKPEEFDGTFETATSLIHPDDLEKVHANIKLGQIEKIPFESEYRIITKDGIMKFVLGTIKLIFDDKGNVIKMVGTLQDITERRRLEEQLQIRQRMDSLGTLAGGIAHDFNNILVGILGNIDLLTLNNENFTPDQKECLTDAGKSCNRAANLIRQFQTLSTGAVRGKTAVDIHDISKEVFSLLKETTDRLITKQIKFKKGEYYVEANSGELHQVLLNLATNSAQAIEERGAYEGDYIRIQAENYEVTTGDRTGLTEGDYVHITIEDSGVGMSEVVLKKAFDPMFSTKDKGVRKGQGLGLAMVYNIISRIYNGHTYIDSKEGKGTTLHIYLPKAQPVDKVEKEKAVDIKGGTETILVVDDEENVRKFTKKLLTQVGYTVITASDGREALKIYKKQKDSIDTVILDLTMPQMSGKQVFQEMLDINPDVKVIISSGHGDEYSKKGILAEAKGNIGKPYKMKALAREVRKVLDS